MKPGFRGSKCHWYWAEGVPQTTPTCHCVPVEGLWGEVSEVFFFWANEWENEMVGHGDKQGDMFLDHAASVKMCWPFRPFFFCNDFLIPEAIMLLDVNRDLLEMLEEESFRMDSAASTIVMLYLHLSLSIFELFSLLYILYIYNYIYALIGYTYSVSKYVDVNKILQTLTFADLPI